MAKLRTPLLSFGATGQLAKTLVAYSWKGIQCARAYIIPPDPKTPAQLTQRSYFRQADYGFRHYLFDDAQRTAWNLRVHVLALAQSGYNRAVGQICRTLPLDANAGFLDTCAWISAVHLRLQLRNMTTGGTACTPETVSCLYGDDPNNLNTQVDILFSPFGGGAIVFPPPVPSPLHLQLTKQFDRSGIHLIPDPP